MRHSLDNFLREVMQEHDGDTCEVDPGSSKEGRATGQTELPGHKVEQLIARGGMGKVYRARQVVLEREVAVKVMSSLAASPKMAERFWREALVLARLEHPNIVPIYDMGMNEEGQPYYTMKLVKGRTLQTILNDLLQGDASTVRGHTLGSLLTVYIKVCDALAFAHSLGILHRDLKPENVMVGQFGEVQVMDWGLAKCRNDDGGMTNDEPELASAADSSFVIRNSSLTLQGAVMGTPQYMSPEQAMGRIDDLDERSDIFSLGGILYAILALRSPVEGGTAREVLEKVRSGSITPPSLLMTNRSRTGGAPLSPPVKPLPHVAGGRVPTALSAVAMKALQADPAKRYQSVTALRADVEAYQNGFATSAQQAGAFTQIRLLMRRHKAISASLAAVAVLSIGFVLKVMASERRAVASESVARTGQESTRRALARAQISLAEAAYREHHSPAMLSALESVPEDLRDGDWRYFQARANTSTAGFSDSTGARFLGVAAHPTQPGVFAACANDQTICFLDAKTGQRVFAFPLTARQKRGPYFYGLDFSPDGKRLAVGGDLNGGIAVYDSGTGKCLVEWDAYNTHKVLFSPDGTRLMDTSHESRTTIRDAATGEPIRIFERTNCAVFTPSGDVVSGCSDLMIRVFRGQDGTVLREIPTPRGAISDLVITPDGGTICYSLFNGLVRANRLADGKVVFEHRLTDAEGHVYLGLGSGGTMLVAANSRNDGFRSIRAWSLENGAQLQVPLGGSGMTADLAVHPLTDELLVTGPDTRAWKLSTSRPEHQVGGVGGTFWSGDDKFLTGDRFLGLHPDADQSTLLWTAPGDFKGNTADAAGDLAAIARRSPNTTAFLMLHKTGDSITPGRAIETSRAMRLLRLSPGGERLASLSPYNYIELFDTGSGELVKQFEITGIQSLRDGDWIREGRFVGVGLLGQRGSSGSQEFVVLWDFITGTEIRRCRGPAGMECLAVAPDGRRFAEAGEDKRVRLRDAETLEVTGEFGAHDASITALAFHPSAPILASASADLMVRLWNLDDCSLIKEFRPSAQKPNSLQFSPSGRRLAATAGGTTLIWEVD